MSIWEIVGVISGLLSVWYATKQSALTWTIGIVNLVCFVVMFASARLYADVLLHVVYLGLSIYGLAKWGGKPTDLRVSRVFWDDGPLVVMIGLIGAWLLMGTLFSRTAAVYPYADSLVTCLSLLACYLMSRKVLESWLVYIVSDVIAIGIYELKGLHLTAALYVIYIVMCVVGYRSWRKTL